MSKNSNLFQKTIELYKKFIEDLPILTTEKLQIIQRFDNLFRLHKFLTNEPISPNEVTRLHKAVTKYCSSDIYKCPICSSNMQTKKGKYGLFLGCTMFPACGGTRSAQGIPTLNKDLVYFLREKLKEDVSIINPTNPLAKFSIEE